MQPSMDQEGAPARRPLPYWLVRAIELASILTLAILFVTILLGAVSRYLALGRFEWSFEVAGMSFVWLTFLGTVLAELNGDNAAFNPLDHRLAPKSRRTLVRVRAAGLLIVALFFGASAVAMVAQGGMTPSPILRWPQAVQTISMAVAAAFIAAIALNRLWRADGSPP